ncbi:MAG: glycosyltransferase [Candidatus Phlomobacter fragariae]
MLEVDKLVTKVINLGDKKLSYSDDVFNIAYGVDKNFLLGTGVSITSIIVNNKDIDFHFHVFTDFFDDEQESLFSQLAKQYNTQITIYLLKCEELKKLPTTQIWSYAIYFRLIIMDYLYDKIKNILYLDSDIFCKGCLSDLKKFNFDDNIILYAVHDNKAKHRSNLKIKTDNYFNSGFLYVSLLKYYKNNITKKVLNQIKINNKLVYPDQDALNICLNENVFLIDVKFNTFFCIDDLLKVKLKNKYFIPQNSVLIHYLGLTKPWHDWVCNYPEIKLFNLTKLNSPWAKHDLVRPKTYKEISIKSKHLKFQDKLFKSFIFFIKYLLVKFNMNFFKT